MPDARAPEPADRAEPAIARPSARSAVPFLLVLLLGVASVGLPPYRAGPAVLATAAGMLAALVAVLRLSLRRSRRSWVDVAAPLGAFPLVVVLREATGGAVSGLSTLVAVPVFWLAVFGTRRDLWASTALTALTFLLPVLLVGPPRYPVDEWRRALVWTAVAGFIAPVVQQVVRRLAVESGQHQALAARLEGILRGATLTGLITLDRTGRITSFGVGAEQQLGYREAEVLGRDLVGLVMDPVELEAAATELDVPPGFAVLGRLAHARDPSRLWTLVRSDGETLYARVAVTPLYDDGRLTGYLWVAIDATAATLAQRSLAQVEERWRLLMQHLPDITLIVVEERTGIILVSGGGALVRRLRDGAGRRLVELVDAGHPGRLGRMLAEAFADQEVAPVLVPVDGVEHELVVQPLPTTTGRRQALVMVRDVSRERERERVLQVALERAERLFDDAPQGIALLDSAGVIVQVNPALTVLLGADVVGRGLSALSYDAEDRTVAEHLDRVRRSQARRDEAAWTLRRDDGAEVHVVLISSLLHGENEGEDRVLTHVVDVSERHRYERQLAFLAEHDPLTGLANRRRFDQKLREHVDRCRRYGPSGALLMLDLDHFKAVNDTLGHATGDRLLSELGELLAHRLRSTDVVARLGGDEFAILLPHADHAAAERVAADVVRRVAGHTGRHADARRGVTVSVGGVLLAAEHHSASEVLSAADAAMYLAKQRGRNRYLLRDSAEPEPRGEAGDGTG